MGLAEGGAGVLIRRVQHGAVHLAAREGGGTVHQRCRCSHPSLVQCGGRGGMGAASQRETPRESLHARCHVTYRRASTTRMSLSVW